MFRITFFENIPKLQAFCNRQTNTKILREFTKIKVKSLEYPVVF